MDTAPVDYDLIVIGAGSGDMLLGADLAGLRVAIVEPDRFGGTCLNRGCIPSKMLVVTADAARVPAESARLGVHAHLEGVDWPAVRDRIFGRIDPKSDQAIASRVKAGFDVLRGSAKFVGPHEIEVLGKRLTATDIVVVTGSHPDIPDIEGLQAVPFHTSDTVMRLDELPESMVIIGGGFIAAEMGHVFASFGTKVSIVQRGPLLLPAEDEAISRSFTALAAARFDLYLGAAVTSVSESPRGIDVAIDCDGERLVLTGEVLLVATGRHPATDALGADAAGLDLDEHGHIVTDEHYRTNVPGVWAFGDAVNHLQLKHLANAEMHVVAHNLLHPDALRSLPSRVIPHAVFSNPQVASVGLTEAQAAEQQRSVVVATRHYSDTAYGWALEDTTSFIKVLADPATRLLLGAHIIGPQAALLLQPLVQAMALGQTVDQVARGVIYIHPALSEVVEQALLEL